MQPSTYTVGGTAEQAVDNVFWFIVIVSVVLLTLVTTLMIYFAVRYNRKKHPEPKKVKQPMWLEITWTLIPTALVLAMFFYGYEGFKLLRNVPDDAMVIKVTARMWDWKFDYPNGKRTDKLYVPVEKNIKLELKSVDVIHSLYMPAFRIKEDAVPGEKTYLWFKPQTVGPADIFCAEYCGQRHAYMLSQVIVMKQSEFDAWYNKKEETEGPDAEFEKLPAVQAMKKHDCLECHSLDASKGDRISLKGLMGQKKTIIRDGKELEITVDEEYIRRAILDPEAETLKGQAEVMPEPDELTAEELKLILEFLKELK